MGVQEKKLGQLLVERGWVSGEQLIRAIQSQRAVGGRIGTCLLEMDVVTEEHLLDALSEQLHVPSVRIEKLRYIADEVLDMVPSKVALRCEAIPFHADDTWVDVATLNVHHLAILDELSFCTSRKVRAFIANEVRIFEALERYYGFECPRRYSHLLDRLNRQRYLWEGRARELLDSPSSPNAPEEDVFWSSPESLLDGDTIILSPSAGGRSSPSPAEQAAGNGSPEALDRLLQSQADHHGVAAVLLGELARRFRRCAVFRVRGHHVLGWLARGADVDAKLFRAVMIDLAEPSIFLNLRQGARFHVGPMPPMPSHRQLVRCWGGEWPIAAFFVPIRLQDRMVAVLYGDCGAAGVADVPLEEIADLAKKGAEAFELCILRKKLQSN